ncbi:MAG: hypothetical protein V4689_21405 [Verrucomicrobiota bacterium]
MSPDQVRVIFERVAYHMVVAAWLNAYSFTSGVGYQLVWRTEGAQKALLLKDLGEKFGLTDDDEAPLHFHTACKGMKLPDGIVFQPIDIEVSAFWLLCINELGLEGDGDGILGMVHIVSSWGPDAESSTRAEE